MTTIAIIGEYDPASPTHAATLAAIRHSSDALRADLRSVWVSTDDVNHALLQSVDGLFIAPGSPYKNFEGALAAIRFAREAGVPCFGTCGGFQHMVLEYARHVLGFEHASHAEYEPNAPEPFITALACSLKGRSMTLKLVPDSLVARCYGTTAATEQYFCNFGVDPSRTSAFQGGLLSCSGSDAEGEVRIVELAGHVFFVGTLFLPQMRSLPRRPHPLISAFLRASLDFRSG
jgi:CTP synthase (UTP-ammonia lyase)